MLDITLKSSDSIETVLPLLEQAMETGDICRINNIDCLGQMGVSALIFLSMAGNLFDSNTGRVFCPQPGFSLIGVDGQGVSRVLG